MQEKPIQQPGRRWLWWAIPFLAVLGSFVVLNLPHQMRSLGTQSYSEGLQSQWTPEASAYVMPVQAGWPLTYWRRFDYPDPAPDSVQWSTPSLIKNASMALLTAVGFACLVFGLNRNRKLFVDSPKAGKSRWSRIRSRRIHLTIADLILITLITALPLAYVQYQKKLAGDDQARRTQLGGDSFVARTLIVPEIIHQWCPKTLWKPWLTAGFMRTVAVELNDPTDPQVEAAVGYSHLRRLSIGGGDYDLDRLANLPNHPNLSALQIAGRPLDEVVLTRIEAMDNLRSLDLSRTNISAETVNRLFENHPGRAARLSELICSDSGIDVSEIDPASLSRFSSLEHLYLPRPPAGSAASIDLAGFAELKELSFVSFDRGVNGQVMSISLSDFPKLAKLDLDRLQKYALDFQRLEQLPSIDITEFKTQMRVGSDQSVPGQLWLESIKLDSMPALKALYFYASDLREVQFSGTPELDFLGPAVFRYRNQRGRRNMSSEYDSEVPPEATAALIDGLSQSDGPRVLDFASVPINDAVFEKLHQNSRLTHLYLDDCGITPANLKTIGQSPHLEVLSIHDGELDGIALAKLVDTMPQLRWLHADVLPITRLRLEGDDQVKGIIDRYPRETGPNRTHLAHCDAIRLVELPQWESAVRLDADGLRHVTLDGLPRIKQVIINSPVPEGVVLRGLDGVRSVAAGGRHLTDEVAADWHRYKNLTRLRLYHTSITPERLLAMMKDRIMTSVDLRGFGNIESAILAMKVSQLDEFRLRGQSLSKQALDHLLSSTWLRVLEIPDTPLTPQAVNQIAIHGSLNELSIGGKSLTADHFKTILGNGLLNSVSIRGATMGADWFTADLDGDAIRKLELTDCTVDVKALGSWLVRYPEIKLGIQGSNIPAMIEGEWMADDRLLDPDTDGDVVYVRGPNNYPFPVDFDRGFMFPTGFSSNQEFEPLAEGVFETLFGDRFDPEQIEERESMFEAIIRGMSSGPKEPNP